MKPILTIDELIESAHQFCEIESRENHIELIGVTDGKRLEHMLNINSNIFSSHDILLKLETAQKVLTCLALKFRQI